MEQKISIRGLTESAVMAAIISIIVVLSSYFLIFQGLSMLILPIIIAIIDYKHGLKYSIACIVTSTLISSILFNPIVGITMALNYGIVGLGLGYGVRNKLSPYKILILTIIAGIISNIATIMVSSMFLMNGKNIFYTIKEQIKQLSETFVISIDQGIKAYETMGITGEYINKLNEMKSMITPELIIIMMPSSLLLVSFIQGYGCYVLLSLILKRLRITNIEIIKFENFYISNLIGATLVGFMSVMIILYGNGVSGALEVYKSIYLISIIILGINGVATTKYFLNKKFMASNKFKNLIIVIMFITGLFSIFVIVGFVEMLMDFRKLDPHRLRKA